MLVSFSLPSSMAVLTAIIEAMVWLVSAVVFGLLVTVALVGGAMSVAERRVAVRIRLDEPWLRRHPALRR